ncbi:MAG: transposase [Candidatus Aureabacteria bacterium]|nr:transposase [Candidatus Auribacterota bacterium]
MSAIAKTYKIPAKEFEKQYKNHLSGFNDWDQKDTAEDQIIFPENIGENLSIDEVAVSNGELYTLLTNKQAHGKKGALTAMCKGTKSTRIIDVLSLIPYKQRTLVKEVTLDMSGSMNMIIRESFPNATIIIDRFHVQKMVTEAVQGIRIDIRKQVIKSENEAYKKSRQDNKKYYPVVYSNEDSKKQLLARSRFLLFKPKSKWTDRQKERAEILFSEYPEIKNAS